MSIDVRRRVSPSPDVDSEPEAPPTNLLTYSRKRMTMSECKDVHLALTDLSDASIADKGSKAATLLVLPVPGSEPFLVRGPDSFEDFFFGFIAATVFAGALLLAAPSLGAGASPTAGTPPPINTKHHAE